MTSYVRDYFDRHALAWVAQYERLDSFPLGWERTRVSLTAALDEAERGSLVVDLGCGGGQLCCQAAELGYPSVGVDIAPAMIREAEDNRRRIPAGAESVEFRVGGFAESGIASGEAAAVTALGLIEYLPDDGPLLAEMSRLLRPRGTAVVTCRNRLFNVWSVNSYTAAEVERGDYGSLLAEVRRHLDAAGSEELHGLAASLALASSELCEVGESPVVSGEKAGFDHTQLYAEERRQHTPERLGVVASELGLKLERVLGVHPHPLPPQLERLAPRAYNRIAAAYQRPLEHSPVSLLLCSTFVAVFRRC